jgi:hypothetical protein
MKYLLFKAELNQVYSYPTPSNKLKNINDPSKFQHVLDASDTKNPYKPHSRTSPGLVGFVRKTNGSEEWNYNLFTMG